jgi:hypothetical protein
MAVRPCSVPPHSLLHRYQDGVGFADCYVTEVPGAFTQAQFIEAFYTSGLFKIERSLLTHLASRPAGDAEVRQLAAGAASRFSAWKVEAQSSTELLLADFTGRTRSWLMVAAVQRDDRTVSTRLHFGSAVVPRPGGRPGAAQMGWLFHALLGFHKLYSRALLSAARRRLQRA